MPEEGIVKRIMPHSEEAEMSVIGAMLLDRAAIETAGEYISGGDFYNKRLGAYFDAITKLHEEGREADAVTLQDRLRDANLPPEFTSAAYISDIVSAVPTSANVKYYAEIVAEHSMRRRLIAASSDIMNESYAGTKDLSDILNDAEKRIYDITQRQNTGEYVEIGTIVVEALSRISRAYKNKGAVTGLATGFNDLDFDTAGFQPSNLIIIAARPGMGKTAFALNIAQYMSMHENHCIALFSLEMNKEELVNRMFAMQSRVDATKLRSGMLTDTELEQLIVAAGEVGTANLIIDDTPGITVSEIRSKCRRYKMDKDLKAIFIDYLQLMSGSGKRATDSRQQEVSEISRGLKALARELDIPVIALSQLNRRAVDRQDSRPMISDLRESGAIEQDADVIMFIHREDYFNKDTEEKGVAEIIIAKQRNGPIGTVKLLWMPEYTKFANLKKR